MKVWTKILTGLGCTAFAFGAMSLATVDDAEACNSQPPPPDCAIAVNCAMIANEMPLTDQTADFTAPFRSSAFVGLTGAGTHPTCQAIERGDVDLEFNFDVEAQCHAPGDPDNMNTEGFSQLTALGELGINNFELDMDFTAGDHRRCVIGGDVTVRVAPPEGQQISPGDPFLNITTVCGEQNICLGRPAVEADGEALVSMDLINEGGVETPIAGEPVTWQYRVTNRSDENFLGFFIAESKNVAGEPVIEITGETFDENCGDFEEADPVADPADCSDEDVDIVCGCDVRNYANTCELENAGVTQLFDGACEEIGGGIATSTLGLITEGDNAPLQFRDEVTTGDACIPMPDNPSAFIAPALEREVNLAPGESTVIEVVQRLFGACLAGTCSNILVRLDGQIGEDDFVGCAGGAMMIDISEEFDTELEVDDDREVCPDIGEPTPAISFPEDDEPDFHPRLRLDANFTGIPDYIEDLHPDLPSEDIDPSQYTRDALLDKDTTENGIPDYVELIYGVFPLEEGDEVPPELSDYPRSLLDFDNAGNWVTDYEEIFVYGSDIYDRHDPVFHVPYITIDTTGSGSPDFIEAAYRYFPDVLAEEPPNPTEYTWEATLARDSDGNGVSDLVQILFGYDHTDASEPTNPADYMEAALQNRDSDGDGLTDYAEIWEHRTHPLMADTDGDGVRDGTEVLLGSDPLNPNDPPNAANSATPDAGIVLKGSQADLSTLFYTPGSEVFTFDPNVQRSTAMPLDARRGRIHQAFDFDARTFTDTVVVEIPFDVGPLSDSSPYEVNRLELGFLDSDEPGETTYLSTKGHVRLDSNPFTYFEFMLQVSAWAESSVTGQKDRLVIDDMDLVINGDSFAIVVDLVIPPGATVDRLILLHDISGNERAAYAEICNDGVDNTGNGLVDCADPYCQQTDPACADWEPEDENGGGDDTEIPGGGDDTEVPGGDDDTDIDPDQPGADDPEVDAGCGGCAATGSGQPVGFVAFLLLGLVVMVRNRRQRV